VLRIQGERKNNQSRRNRKNNIRSWVDRKTSIARLSREVWFECIEFKMKLLRHRRVNFEPETSIESDSSI
jgi:hypothetical protein